MERYVTVNNGTKKTRHSQFTTLIIFYQVLWQPQEIIRCLRPVAALPRIYAFAGGIVRLNKRRPLGEVSGDSLSPLRKKPTNAVGLHDV
jgi:hypothetical protein